MAKKLSTQTIMQMIDLNQMTNVRSSPMNPAVSRAQTRNYTEGGSGAKFLSGDHIIVNLQTGTNWIDVLQSFLVFDFKPTGNASVFLNSALSLFSECQVVADNQDVDRTRFLNVLNYRRISEMSQNQRDLNYNALFFANDQRKPFDDNEYKASDQRLRCTTATAETIMIPLKFLGGIFDSYKLMPPHLARGLRVDITCEAFAKALVEAIAGAAPTGYEITGVNILTDSYRMDTAILEFVNAEYASSKDGLIYEYFSYNAAKSTNVGTAISIEFNQSSSQTVDAMVVQTLTAAASVATDSLMSAVLPAGVASQWRIGSHYMPNQLTKGPVEHYAQYLYYLNFLRENKEVGVQYGQFVGRADNAPVDSWGVGKGAFAQTFQRSNMVEVSGMAVNMNSSLGFLAENVTANCDVFIFVRHLRRAVLFLQSMTLET